VAAGLEGASGLRGFAVHPEGFPGQGWGTVARRLLSTILMVVLPFGLPAAVRGATINGFVRGAGNGEALSFANVSLVGTRLGAVTNHQGHYVITGIPPGNYRIVFSYIGYRPSSRNLMLGEKDELTITAELQPQAVGMPQIDVQARPDELALEPEKLSLRTKELVRVPSAVDMDVFRAVQSLPGVSSLSDYSAGLYVQGGSADQNLVLLDDTSSVSSAPSTSTPCRRSICRNPAIPPNTADGSPPCSMCATATATARSSRGSRGPASSPPAPRSRGRGSGVRGCFPAVIPTSSPWPGP